MCICMQVCLCECTVCMHTFIGTYYVYVSSIRNNNIWWLSCPAWAFITVHSHQQYFILVCMYTVHTYIRTYVCHSPVHVCFYTYTTCTFAGHGAELETWSPHSKAHSMQQWEQQGSLLLAVWWPQDCQWTQGQHHQGVPCVDFKEALIQTYVRTCMCLHTCAKDPRCKGGSKDPRWTVPVHLGSLLPPPPVQPPPSAYPYVCPYLPPSPFAFAGVGSGVTRVHQSAQGPHRLCALSTVRRASDCHRIFRRHNQVCSHGFTFIMCPHTSQYH